MPIIKSAKKRVRVAHKASLRNSKSKRSLRSAVKSFHKAVTGKNSSTVTKAHRTAQSELGKAGKKKILHKNKVARKQRQLSRAAKTVATAKVTPKVKKSPVKKTTKTTRTPKKKTKA